MAKRTKFPTPRVVNIKDVCMIERIGPDYSDFHFKLKFWGNSPNGEDLRVIVEMPAWGVEHMAEKLHEVQKEHERHVANSRKALQTGSIL